MNPTESQPMGLLDRAKSALGVLTTGKIPNPLASEPDDKSRAALVQELNEWCVNERKFWKPIFDRIKEEQRFAAGKQWPKDYRPKGDDTNVEAYVGDVIQQMLNRKTATLFAKNPTPQAKQRDGMFFEIWDGEQSSINGAKAMMQQATPILVEAQQLKAKGVEVPPPPTELSDAMKLLADYEQGMARKALLSKIAKTATLLITKQWEMQSPSMMVSMKQLVTRVITSRVAYIKVMYRRDMEKNPAQQGVQNLADKLAQLKAQIERMSDPDFDPQGAEAKEIELLVSQLHEEAQEPDEQIVSSEGVVDDYPSATSIIIDRRCRSMREFINAQRIAHEKLMTVEECEARYGKSLRDAGAVMYSDDGCPEEKNRKKDAGDDKLEYSKVCVFEIQDKTSGNCYHVCDGVKDFMEEPYEHEPKVRRFWTLIPVCFNVQEVEFNDPEADVTIYPRSDVRLAMPMQIDINRAGEGLREHRSANRPAFVGVKDRFVKGDLEKLSAPRAAFALILLESLNKGEKIDDFIQRLPTVEISETLYSPAPAMQAMMQSTGIQAADLGQQRPNEKATGQEISARQKASSDGSNIDDLDFALSVKAQMTWEMLIQEMPAKTVKQIVGPGAVWPILPAERVSLMNQIYLEIEAGSSGRPDQAQEIENFKIVGPQLAELMRSEGKSLEPLIKEGVRVLGSKLDVDTFLQPSKFPMPPEAGGPAGAAAAPAPPPPKGPSISAKLADLTPDERAQALAEAGIKATPGAHNISPPATPTKTASSQQPAK